MLKRSLVEIAETRPLTEKVERMLAAFPDPDVRRAWARQGEHRSEVVQERITCEHDPSVLSALLCGGAELDAAQAAKLARHDDLEVSLRAALHPATPDADAARAVRRNRTRSKGRTEELLGHLRLQGASGKEETTCELVSRLDPWIATSAAPLCTTEPTRRALLGRVRSLNSATEANRALVRAAAKAQWTETELMAWDRALRRMPEELASEGQRLSREQMDRAAAQAARKAEAERAAAEAEAEANRRVGDVGRRAGLPGERAGVLAEVAAACAERDQRLGWRLAAAAFEHGEWDVSEALQLVGHAERSERGRMLKVLAERELEVDEYASVLEAAGKLTSVPTRSGYPVLTECVRGQADAAMEARAHLSRGAGEQVLLAVAGDPHASVGALVEVARHLKDGTELGRQGYRMILANPGATTEVLAHLPAKVVLNDRRGGTKVALAALEELSSGELEVFAALCDEPQGSVVDLKDAARNALTR